MTCKRCEFDHKVSTPCMPGIGTHGDIMVIGDMVSFYEDSSGDAFSGASSKQLTQELLNVGIDLTLCYYTKAIKCYTPTKPKRPQTKACREVLLEEVRRIKPKYILALGALSLEVMYGKNVPLTKNRGALFTWEGASCVATYHPNVISNQPEYLRMFRADLNYFSRVTEGEWKPPNDFKWELVNDEDAFIKMITHCSTATELSYDIETTSLKDITTGKLLMLGLGVEGMNYVIPLETSFSKLNIPEVADTLKTLLGKNKIIKIAQNAKFDNRWLRSRGVDPSVTFDTFLAAYVINNALPHGLKYMAKTYCGAGDYGLGIEFKEDLTEEEFLRMSEYCALDVYYTLKLYPILKEELEKDEGLYRVFKYIIMPGERVLQKIETRGIHVHKDRLKQVKEKYTLKKNEIKGVINESLPERWKDTLNINSTKQLAELLFGDLGLPILDRTASGAPSTGRAVLVKLAQYHHLPKALLEYRRYEKALNGFLTPWGKYLAEGDGRLHTTYKIAHTATGRLSAEDPNLQQVPRDMEVRSLVGAPEGWDFVEADFSQIELRVAAFIASADSMKRVYAENGDIHTLTAARVAGVAPSEVTKGMRNKAKAVNFGFLFGMWWKAFKDYAFDSYNVIVTDEEAKHARETYFELYPELVSWHSRQKREVQNFKRVRTPLGRIRHLPNIDSSNRDLVGEAERQAINTPVQSMASDMTLLAMILIDQELEKRYGEDAFLIGQVHDSIMVQARPEISHEVAVLIKNIMQGIPKIIKKYFGVTFDVPIIADVAVGSGDKAGWGLGEEIKIS